MGTVKRLFTSFVLAPNELVLCVGSRDDGLCSVREVFTYTRFVQMYHSNIERMRDAWI